VPFKHALVSVNVDVDTVDVDTVDVDSVDVDTVDVVSNRK